MLRIDRCICTNQLFASLQSQAREVNGSLEGVCDATGAGRQCTLCRPYLREMQRTGETVFHRLIHAPNDGTS